MTGGNYHDRKKQLEALLTGNSELDRLIREAFEAGRKLGMTEDREGLKNTVRIETTKKLLLQIMCQQRITLEQAMAQLNIPRKERKAYVGLLKTKRQG